MNSYNNQLTVLKKLTENETFDAFIKNNGDDESFYAFLGNLLNSGNECNFYGWLQELILCDKNAFSVCCAEGKTPSEYLHKAFIHDLKLILDLARNINDRNMFAKGNFSYPFDTNFQPEITYENLKNFYRENGYGIFIKNTAFVYKDNKLQRIDFTSNITPDMLKNYVQEKKIIENNLINFLDNLPYEDMLLYGEKGTGKSSTVLSMLNKYRNKGLRLIELSKEQLLYINDLRQILSSVPLKFIIFIDDLTLDENDEKTSSLKASIEGSVSSYGNNNSMIIATSNRRHIIKETFAERQNSVHYTDTMDEQLSLSDRFGITVLFSSTDKDEYLSIVRQLAADRKLIISETELFEVAERWALTKGGRSPRRAKQIVDIIYSSQISGNPIVF